MSFNLVLPFPQLTFLLKIKLPLSTLDYFDTSLFDKTSSLEMNMTILLLFLHCHVSILTLDSPPTSLKTQIGNELKSVYSNMSAIHLRNKVC